MSTSRQLFLDRIQSFRFAAQHPDLIAHAPTDVEHNNRARLLRNGLAVVAFALLEDFIRSRLSEILRRVGSSHLPFDQLPEALRDAAVMGALKAVNFHSEMRRRQGEDQFSFIQTETRLISSTSTVGYELSGMSLGRATSNLNDTDIKEILRAFKIKDAWSHIDALAARVGVASPSLRDSFKQAALRRHHAAHRADADTESSQLDSFYPQSMGIALAVDTLVSKSLRRILDHNSDFLDDNGEVRNTDITIRFIETSPDNWWREVRETGRRAVTRSRDVDALLATCLARPNAHNDLIVVRDASQQPLRWFIPEVA